MALPELDQLARCYGVRRRILERWQAAGLDLENPDALVRQAAGLPGSISGAVLELLDPAKRQAVRERIDSLSKPSLT